MLIHEDGRRLWNVPLDAPKRLLWAHRRADVYEIAAAPDGRSLAYSVQAAPPKSSKQVSFFLYLLRPDGKVELIDTVRNYGSIESPVFLRSVTEPSGPVRLYWIRSYDDLDSATGRPKKRVMVLDGGRRERVRVALRFAEAPDGIWGYAGSPLFAITVYRRDDVPTRLEVLRTADYQSVPLTSLRFWTVFAPVANTDVFSGIAWISPRNYVVPVGQRFYKSRYSLRLFRAGCEYYGSHLIYQGRAIDWGFTEAFWPLLPAGEDRVLVLEAAAAAKVRARQSRTAPWSTVDIRTGAIRQTRAQWTPDGWWTFVQPAMHGATPTPIDDASCGSYSWTYP